MTRSLLTKRTLESDGFIDEFDKTFSEELIPTLLKLSQRTIKEKALSNLF